MARVARPPVSVVMPFAGDEPAAQAAVDALLALDLRPGDELILADNSGTAVARDGVAVIPASGERSPAHARNVGAARAHGEWILFLDADCRAPRGLLDAYFAAPVADDVGALAGEVVPAPDRRHARVALRLGPRLPLPTDASQPPVPAARGGGEPAGPPRGLRADRRLLRGRPGGRGHRLQLASAGRRAGSSSCAGAPRSSTATGAPWASCAASGAAMRPAAPGWPAATTGSHPSRPWSGRLGRLRHRSRAAIGPGGSDRAAPPGRGAPAGRGRAARARAATWPSTRSCRPRSWPGWRCPTGRRTAGAIAADVVVVADRFPVRGDPRVEFVRALERARVEAVARPESARGATGHASFRSITARTTESPPAPARSLALLVRHPVRCRRRPCRPRRPGDPGLSALAPAVLRLLHDRRAGGSSPRAGRRRDARHRPPAVRGWPGGRSTSPGADASPHRRPVGVHAPLRPRAGERAGPSRRRGRADHQPVRLRLGPRARRLRGARAVLPPCAAGAPGIPDAAGRQAARARARHAPLPDGRPRRRRRPLPVAGRPGARSPPSPRPADRPDRPRPAPARAPPRAGAGPAPTLRRDRRDRRALGVRPRSCS